MATHSFLLLCLFVAATSLLPQPSHGDKISGSTKSATCMIHMDELVHFGPRHRAAAFTTLHGVRQNAVASLDQNGTGHGASCPQVSKMVAQLKRVHPNWSLAAVKSAITTTARSMDHHDGGRGLGLVAVDLHRAMDPGLIYDDTNAKKHRNDVNFLCSLNHTKNQNSAIVVAQLKRHDNCSRRPSIRDFNYPSFIALYDNKKASPRVVVQKFRRTVTYVGEGGGVYRIDVAKPRGSISVTVHPKTLVFAKKYEKKRYTLILKYVKDKKESVSQGWISWNKVHGQYKVRSPIVIAPLIPMA